MDLCKVRMELLLNHRIILLKTIGILDSTSLVELKRALVRIEEEIEGNVCSALQVITPC